ncbi:MAG TPA: tetratricopeptide repeat protein [Polyangiaceae bacterium]|jgi:tetratricopeptide (TPR) repeat protein|nr:tetratricopeptide repeat protein [Polyangiaceae bacterium]
MNASAKLGVLLRYRPAPALLLALGLCAAPASAANESRPAASASQTNVAQLNEEGAALYAARDYRHAIEKFIQAYAVDSDPNLLFNIARCYEELGETDAAIEKYETFLKTPGADARGRQRARESLAALREAAELSRQNAGAPSARTPSHDSSSAEPSSAPSQADAPTGPSYVPWVVLGGSVAAAALGTTFYLMGVSDHNKVENAPGFGDPTAVTPLTQHQAQDLVDSGKSKKLIGGISFGVAGALAATYVVLLVTDDRPAASEGPSLALDWSPRGPSFSVQGSF